MDDKQNARDNTAKKPVVIPPDQIIQNPNPKADKNIRVRTNDSKPQNTEPAQGVGSEITDEEDA